MNLQNDNKIRIAFFDIDGTLIDINHKSISDKTLEALNLLKDNGVRICIATGRPPQAVPHFPGVEFDIFLTFNASYCYTKDAVIFSNPIPSNDVQKIIQNAAAIHRPVSIAGADEMGANGLDQDLIDYYSISKQTAELAKDFDALTKKEIYQIMLGCRESDYSAILKDVDGAKITAWWTRAADIIPANGGKGLGVEKVLAYYGLTKEQAIAFGDGTNDIEMLAAVGHGIAMGNATNDVKEIADDICGTASNDGIYHYCLEHHLF